MFSSSAHAIFNCSKAQRPNNQGLFQFHVDMIPLQVGRPINLSPENNQLSNNRLSNADTDSDVGPNDTPESIHMADCKNVYYNV